MESEESLQLSIFIDNRQNCDGFASIVFQRLPCIDR